MIPKGVTIEEWRRWCEVYGVELHANGRPKPEYDHCDCCGQTTGKLDPHLPKRGAFKKWPRHPLEAVLTDIHTGIDFNGQFDKGPMILDILEGKRPNPPGMFLSTRTRVSRG